MSRTSNANHGRNPDLPLSISPRFWRRVHKTDSCWLWTGAVERDVGDGKKGYGYLSQRYGAKVRKVKAHHISYRLHFGPLKPGQVIRHRCHNRLCVNPDHLEVGTHAENMRDMVMSGRASKKLNADKVFDIRWAYAQGASIAELAEAMRVSRSCIEKVVRWETWRHLLGPWATTLEVAL